MNWDQTPIPIQRSAFERRAFLSVADLGGPDWPEIRICGGLINRCSLRAEPLGPL